MKKFGKRFTSLLLVLLLLVTSVIGTRTVYAEGEEADESLLSWEVVENDAERAASKMDKANFEAATEWLAGIRTLNWRYDYDFYACCWKHCNDCI